MNMKELAKDLINAGHALNDQQLISMGYTMLKTYVEEPVTKSQPQPVVPTRLYRCSACKFEMDYDKDRKRCLNCKKHKLQLIEIQPGVRHRVNTTDFITPTKKESHNRHRINPETGEVKGTYTRSEAIVLNSNSFMDNEDIASEDRQSTLQIKQKLSNGQLKFSKRRPRVQLINKICEKCSKTYTVQPMHMKQYLCDKCIRGSRSRNE